MVCKTFQLQSGQPIVGHIYSSPSLKTAFTNKFYQFVMHWVQVNSSSCFCDSSELCYRPDEFLEPLICVISSVNPNNFHAVPTLQTLEFYLLLVLVFQFIALLVCALGIYVCQ